VGVTAVPAAAKADRRFSFINTAIAPIVGRFVF